MEKGKQEGASLLIGGEKLENGKYQNGYYVQPAIFDNVTSEMTIAQEEIFGPVIALIKVDSMEEALNIANDVKFGLSASIFTENISECFLSLMKSMPDWFGSMQKAQVLSWQAPFGGMKQSSSHSREQGEGAKDFFTAIKTVFVKP
nr:aldehyde dehydrogenase family protein [Bacillus subtilis]